MDFIASNVAWTGRTWTGGMEQISMPQTMVQDANEVLDSMMATHVWGYKKTLVDDDELLDGPNSQSTTNHSKLMSTSLYSGSGGKSSSSSSPSSSSPTQLFEENELAPTLKPSKSSSSFSPASPTFDDFGSMMVNNRRSFTPRAQQASMTPYGLERPRSADVNRAHREYTETVAVESSACVAQIVGKNGKFLH